MAEDINYDALWDSIEQNDVDNTGNTDNTVEGELVSVNEKSDINYTPNDKSTKIIPVTKSGAFIKFEWLGKNMKLIKKIENYFTLRTKLITGAIKQFKCCSVDKKKERIIVPRFGVFEILNDKFKLGNFRTKSQIRDGQKPETTYSWKGKLTNNQNIIYEEIFKNYYTNKRVEYGSAGLILNLEAGQGKSYLAAYVAYKLQKKTAIIMHSTSLLEQWSKVLQNCFGKSVSIGYYYAKKKVDGDFVLIIIDSATSHDFKVNGEIKTPIEYFSQFGFIIYDECHTYANKFSQKALRVAQAPYMLGLSATPDENTQGFDPAVWWDIGPILTANALDGYEATSENFSATVHRIMYYGSPTYTKQIINEHTSLTSTSETINMICEDNIRTSIVIDCIMNGLDKGLYMFVFADRREYLLMIQEQLKAIKNIEGEIVDNDKDFVRIVGGAKNAELEDAEINSRVIFTTYQYMGTGKSIIKMNGLVLATPRKTKMKQYINRIFRLGSDESIERHIWDICDMKLKLANQWNARHSYYKEKNYNIVTEKIRYEDYNEEEIDGAEITEIKEIKETSNIPVIKTLTTQMPDKKILDIVSNIMKCLKK